MGTNQRKRRTQRRQIVLVLLLALLAVFVFREVLKRQAEAELLSMVFVNPQGKHSSEFKLEVMRSEAERRRGLMYRKELDPERGMLFVYPEEQNITMWMKNTYLPLDMIFIDSDKKVVGVLENVPILNEETRKVDAKSRYVVELNAGSVKANQISIGSKALYTGNL